MSTVNKKSSNKVKNHAALNLLHAYLSDFVSNTATMTVNHRLLSPWFDGALDTALHMLRSGNLPRMADALAQASDLAAEPVVGWPEYAPIQIQAAQMERGRIALAVSVACALFALAEAFTDPSSVH